MIRLRVPATSANIGPGFDTLGIAWNLYNEFEVETADETHLDNVEDRFQNEDNLFLKSWRSTCRILGHPEDNVHAVFHCNIPISRGLGSSSTLICAGILAANALHNGHLSRQTILELAAQAEGHPDNSSPCICGGMTAALIEGSVLAVRSLPLADDWIYTILYPDAEVSTKAARDLLPKTVALPDAARNTAHAILMVQALADGDLPLLKLAAHDVLHEPYRKKMIPGFDGIASMCKEDTDGIFLISGSGSACLLISRRPLSAQALRRIGFRRMPPWHTLQVSPAYQGIEIQEADTWHRII